MKSLFDRYAEEPKARAEQPAATGSACLLQEWPTGFAQAKAHHAGIYAFKAASPLPRLGGAERRSARRTEFFPDDSVLEAGWAQSGQWAARVEDCRSQLGLESPVFDGHARRALWLRKAIERRNIRHLHAVGPEAILCASLLQKLCGITVSCDEAANAGAAKRVPFLRKLTSAFRESTT